MSKGTSRAGRNPGVSSNSKDPLCADASIGNVSSDSPRNRLKNGTDGAPSVESTNARIVELITTAAKLWNLRRGSQIPEEPRQDEQKELSRDASPVQKNILECLQRFDALRPDAISKAVNISPASTQRNLRELLRKGLVSRSGSTRRVCYRLPKTEKT